MEKKANLILAKEQTASNNKVNKVITRSNKQIKNNTHQLNAIM